MSGKKRKQGMKILLAAIIGCGMLSGCGEKEKSAYHKEQYTVGAVTKSKDSEYWMSVCSGMEKAAKDLGVSVMILSPETESDDKVQKKMIHDLIQKGVDALAISPIQSYDAAYLEEAKEKQIPVISYDTRIVEEGVPYVGIDNRKAGEELAKTMAEQLGNTGKVGIISGDLHQTAHKERMEGICSYIEKNTEIEIAFVESGYSNLLMSEKKISNLMEENPNINGIFATSAVTALGIMEYMQDSPIKIMTVDAQQDAIEAVKDGGIAALVAQSGYDIGYAAIEYIVSHKDETMQEQKDEILDIEMITKENVETWKE
ncbi:MAG: substrate-binding domain-containing protein [Lachnospiraceae bacterium]